MVDRWSDLDLYNGLVHKVHEMIEKRKFDRYVMKYNKGLLRGFSNENEVVVTTKHSVKAGHTEDVKNFIFKFQLFPAGNYEPEESTLNIEYKSESSARGSSNFTQVSLSHFHIKFSFQFDELRNQGINLETVLTHYFENAFMEVPTGNLVQEQYYEPVGSQPSIITHIVSIRSPEFERRYRTILNHMDRTIAIGMGDHKRLGAKSMLMWLASDNLQKISEKDMPDYSEIRLRENPENI